MRGEERGRGGAGGEMSMRDSERGKKQTKCEKDGGERRA